MKKNKTIIASFVLLSILALLVPMAKAATPIVQQVTGGGWILDCHGDKCTFGFNAEQLEDLTGPLRGNVEYVDHGTGYPHVHGYEIDSLTIVGNQATITGKCRLNGDLGPYDFTVVVVDNGEPGTHDTFWIYISGVNYLASGELGFPDNGGGNIQIHVPAP
jgi:hypothetical protein